MEDNNNGLSLLLISSAARILLETVLFESESESEDEEILEDAQLQYHRGEKPVRIELYYESVIPRLNDTQFQNHFRITREIFVILENAISPLLRKKPNASRKTVEERKQLLMVLWILATPDSYRSIGERFDIAKSTLWRCFYRTIRALNQVSTRFIVWPNPEQRTEIVRDFSRFGDLPNVVGAIDGTYVPIKAPKENPEVYVNRKCFHAITLQIIADSHLRILHCFAGYPSSVSDVRIFKNSDIYTKIIQNPQDYLQEEQFIIGDKAYPILKWCIPPYINRGGLIPRQINFNTVHAKLRQCVERTFALFYGRMRRSQHLDMNRFDLYAYVIKAACVLHNMCLLAREENIENYIQEGLPVVHNNDDLEMENNVHVDIRALAVEGNARRDALARQLQP